MDAACIGRAAVRALYQELTLEPKPGLVSLRDSGSHDDMDAATFVRSLFALRGYFVAIARAGAEGARFEVLEALGRQAEARMLAATGGVNTHRGAVFALGLLCASAGAASGTGSDAAASRRRTGASAVAIEGAPTASALGCLPGAPSTHPLRSVLLARWGEALRARADRALRTPPASHGQRAARRYGLRSAGAEAAAGFPVLFEVTWPALRHAQAAGAAARAARAQALFETIAVLDDTNLAHRGGLAALRGAQRAAREFLADGGVFDPGWVERARAIHGGFVRQRWSPGGAADLLGCACWLDAVCAAGQPQPAAAEA